MVMPMAPPSSNATSSTEAAMPARSAGARLMMAFEATAIDAPNPNPKTDRLRSCGVGPASAARNRPATARPPKRSAAAITWPVPYLGADQPASGPPMKASSDPGSTNSAACSGE